MNDEIGKIILKIEYGSDECKIYFTDGSQLIIAAISGMDDSDTYPELEYKYK